MPISGHGIALCEPQLHGNEWRYLKECLDTNWVSSAGPFVARLEQQVADFVGARHGVGVSTGTAALHVSLLVAGVQPHDEVLLPALTFIAPANAVRYVGAWPVFMDVEESTWQLDPQRVQDFLERHCQRQDGVLKNKNTGRRVRALLPVDILGHPVDLDPLLALAKRYELQVIEDATESLGAQYKGERIGARADIACFSFNGNKIVTCGGGGMIVTNRSAWAEKARYLTTQAKDDPFESIHREVGFNYRLTNLQAAVGVAQMEQIDAAIAAKRRIAETYREAFRQVAGLSFMPEAEWAKSIYWMSTIRVEEERYGQSSRSLLKKLSVRNIQARPLWQPLSLSPAHHEAYADRTDVAVRIAREAVNLPSSCGLTAEEQKRVIEAIVG